MAIPTTSFAGRFLGLLALGAAAFTVYGSLVPLDFRSRELGETANSFVWAMKTRWWIESRSDGLANVLLGIPLGFGLLGLIRWKRANRLGDLAASVALLPLCLTFAAAVEFAQLYVPERTCAGSDVLCQGFGAVLGMALWVAWGRGIVCLAEEIWNGAESAGQWFFLYLALLAFMQLLPLDLSPSPRSIYHKLRDDAVFVPLSEFREADSGRIWRKAAGLFQVFGLYVPLGWLARNAMATRAISRFPGDPILASWMQTVAGRWVLPVSIAVAVGLEGLQVIVQSRTPSATDVLVGTAGALAGWWLNFWPRIALEIAWAIGLIVVSWQPFTMAAEPIPFEWLPGLPLEQGNPMFAIEDMLTKVILFGLLGVLASSGKGLRGGHAAGLGLFFSGVLEAGQTRFAGHTPGITDVLLGGLGAWLGCRALRNVVHS